MAEAVPRKIHCLEKYITLQMYMYIFLWSIPFISSFLDICTAYYQTLDLNEYLNVVSIFPGQIQEFDRIEI